MFRWLSGVWFCFFLAFKNNNGNNGATRSGGAGGTGTLAPQRRAPARPRSVRRRRAGDARFVCGSRRRLPERGAEQDTPAAARARGTRLPSPPRRRTARGGREGKRRHAASCRAPARRHPRQAAGADGPGWERGLQAALRPGLAGEWCRRAGGAEALRGAAGAVGACGRRSGTRGAAGPALRAHRGPGEPRAPWTNPKRLCKTADQSAPPAYEYS